MIPSIFIRTQVYYVFLQPDMATFLFDKIIFGPVKSRRLGISLGINLLPADKKLCNFNCIYCECGWNGPPGNRAGKLPRAEEVSNALRTKLKEMITGGLTPDVITFAGNGEPTMHPEFPGIIRDCIEIRDTLCRNARIAVLTNSTLIHKKEIAEALKLVDQNILKLDTVFELTFRSLNKPAAGIYLNRIIDDLINLEGRKIIQTLFVRGKTQNQIIDNTTVEEIAGLIGAYKKIKPESIMAYTYERDTAMPGLERISRKELEKIADQLIREGFVVEISS